MQKQRIGIFFGGLSNEREVSLNSGRHVYNIIDRARFEPLPIFVDSNGKFWNIPLPLVVQNTTNNIASRLSEAKRILYEDLQTMIDVAFPITFGSYGEDGCLQGLLTLLNIPFVGSTVLPAALGQDKAMQRILLKENPRINTPPYMVTNTVDISLPLPFSFPVVTKPARGGSSLGVEVVKKNEDLHKALEKALEHDSHAIIEPWLNGLEFSCVVMEDAGMVRALTPTETVHTQEIFTYNEKYMPGASNKITPARVEPEIITAIQQMCVETFTTLGFSGWSRIDGFVLRNELPARNASHSDAGGRVTSYELGIDSNSSPDTRHSTPFATGTILITDPNVYSGLSPSSWTFHQAAHEHWSPTEFITKLIETAK